MGYLSHIFLLLASHIDRGEGISACSFDPRKGIDSDLYGPGSQEGSGTLTDGCAGCEHIVNQQEPPVLHSIRLPDGKGAFDVLLSLSPTPTLCLRGPGPMQYTVTNGKSPTVSKLLCQKYSLVEASQTLPLGMKWNRDQEIKSIGIEEAACRLNH
jgi:hypothetical protein